MAAFATSSGSSGAARGDRRRTARQPDVVRRRQGVRLGTPLLQGRPQAVRRHPATARPHPRAAHRRPGRQGGRAGHQHQGLLHHHTLRRLRRRPGALRSVAKKPLREAIEDAWLACAPEPLAQRLPRPVPGPSQVRGTPHESLKRTSTQRSSDGTHSHSVMERVHDAHPAPPVDLGRHAEEGDHGRLDDPGVDGGHHQLARVGAHHVAYGARSPQDEPRPALASRRDRDASGRCPSRAPRRSRPCPPTPCRRTDRGAARRGRSVHAPGRGPSGPGPPRAGAAPPSRRPGAAPRSTAPSRRAARRSRRAGRPGPPPVGAPGRSVRCSPGARPRRGSRLHSASPWRTSTIRAAPGFGGKIRSTPACGAGHLARPSSPALTPGCRRSAPAGAACGTPPPRRSGRRTRPRSSRPSPSSRAARG